MIWTPAGFQWALLGVTDYVNINIVPLMLTLHIYNKTPFRKTGPVLYNGLCCVTRCVLYVINTLWEHTWKYFKKIKESLKSHRLLWELRCIPGPQATKIILGNKFK
jgi:hypothetical protein